MRIKDFLVANKLRQVDLARFLGISEPAVTNMVSEKSNPSPENLIKILGNSEGWDVSMLQCPSQSNVNGDNINGSTINYSDGSEEDKKRVKCGEIRSDEVLNKVLDMLDLLNRDLLSRMGRLEHDMGELIASLREKDAQLSKLIDKLG